MGDPALWFQPGDWRESPGAIATLGPLCSSAGAECGAS